MSALLEAATSWKTYIGAALLFGFLPGFVLRAVVLLYPREDPRRTELLSELYAMPRVRRPLWVAEQIETALWEGPRARRRVRTARRAAGDSSWFVRHRAVLPRWVVATAVAVTAIVYFAGSRGVTATALAMGTLIFLAVTQTILGRKRNRSRRRRGEPG